MDNFPHVRLPLTDRSYVSIVKKEIHRIAEGLGFTPYQLGEIDIIVAEITSNIIKHSKEGEILVKTIIKDSTEGIEIISIDKGPGIIDLKFVMKDGVSTAKTLGQGLGSIKRLSSDFDIYSLPGWGTIVLSRYYKTSKNPSVRDILDINALVIPKPGEVYCGDGFKYILEKNLCKILVVDGLGHGVEANKASLKAIEVFSKEDYPPAEIVKLMHKEIRGTRGAVGMVFHIDVKNKSLLFCGVGNISGRIMGEGKTRSCISYNGIVGHSMPNSIHQNAVEWNRTDMLIITSDGLKSRWEIEKFPGVLKHDGSILASCLYREYTRGNDDLSIIIVRGIIR